MDEDTQNILDPMIARKTVKVKTQHSRMLKKPVIDNSKERKIKKRKGRPVNETELNTKPPIPKRRSVTDSKSVSSNKQPQEITKISEFYSNEEASLSDDDLRHIHTQSELHREAPDVQGRVNNEIKSTRKPVIRSQGHFHQSLASLYTETDECEAERQQEDGKDSLYGERTFHRNRQSLHYGDQLEDDTKSRNCSAFLNTRSASSDNEPNLESGQPSFDVDEYITKRRKANSYFQDLKKESKCGRAGSS